MGTNTPKSVPSRWGWLPFDLLKPGCPNSGGFRAPSDKKKAHKHKPFCPVGLETTPGQTRVFSLFYTVEARFHRACPWDKPGLSLGQSRGRRAAEKVYVRKVYVPLSLAAPWVGGGVRIRQQKILVVRLRKRVWAWMTLTFIVGCARCLDAAASREQEPMSTASYHLPHSYYKRFLLFENYLAPNYHWHFTIKRSETILFLN